MGSQRVTLFEPVDPAEMAGDLARSFDRTRNPLERLAAASAVQRELFQHFPELVHKARTHGASWQTIAAILNLDVDEVAAGYRSAVVREAQRRPGWDAAQAWAVVQRVGQ